MTNHVYSNVIVLDAFKILTNYQSKFFIAGRS